MLMRKFFLLLAGAAIGGVVVFAPSQVSAQGLPMSCTTGENGFGDPNWVVTANPGGDPAFPRQVTCNDGTTCSEWEYQVAIAPLFSKNAAHVVVAINVALQAKDFDIQNASANVFAPCEGGGNSVNQYLANACHEFAVRLNADPGTFNVVFRTTSATPELRSIYVVGGNKSGACAIAGPGSFVNPLTPVAQAQTQLAAGGKCEVNLIYDAAGNVVDVTLPAGSTCTLTTGDVFINGGPIRDNRGRFGITHGEGTCTTYGPPIPSPARTVCN